MSDVLGEQETTTTALRPSDALDQTRTSADALAERAGFLRTQVRFAGTRAASVHSDALAIQLRDRTNEMRKRNPQELLNALAAEGFSWRDIARVVGVSVPALRKWREGGRLSAEHAVELARLCAFFDIAKSDHLPVHDAVAWLEQPLVPHCGVTGLDFAADHHYEVLLELAAGHVPAEELLDRYHPDWRNELTDDVEVFIASDGQPGIRVAG